MALDAVVQTPVSGQQNDPCPPIVLLRAVSIRDDRLKTSTVGSFKGDGDSLAHSPDSHTTLTSGIRYRNLFVRSDPLAAPPSFLFTSFQTGDVSDKRHIRFSDGAVIAGSSSRDFFAGDAF